MNQQHGFTLIELVMFIALASLMMVGILNTNTQILFHSSDPLQLTAAQQIAQQRMELIFGVKRQEGFAKYGDPCVVGTPPAICTPPAGYAITPTTTAGANETVISVKATTPSASDSVTIAAIIGNF